MIDQIDPLAVPALSEAELAQRWDMSEMSMRSRRSRTPDKVPPFIKIGKRPVSYPIAGVFAFEQNLIEQNQRA